MARPVVQVAGAKELRRQLKAAGDDLEDLKAANKEAAHIVELSSVALAPVTTGALMHSIRSSGTKTAGIVRAGRSSLPYAGPIHWGWPKRNIKAQPFMLNAAHQSEPRWVEAYSELVDKALAKVKGQP